MSAGRSLSSSLAWALGEVFTPSSAAAEEVHPDALYERAMRLQREGQTEAALETYSEVIRADADFAEAYYGRATVCYALGNCDQAINDSTRAIELRRGFAEAYLVRGSAFWGKASQCDEADPYRAGYCEQAISDCTRVLDAQPRNGQAHFNRGIAYMALGNKPMAKHDLENAVVLLREPGWRAAAESWLKELKKPRLLQRYEGKNLA